MINTVASVDLERMHEAISQLLPSGFTTLPGLQRLKTRVGDKSLVARCQSSATEPSHNTFEFRIVRLSTVRPDAISSEDPL